MTKTEQALLAKVRAANMLGALAGLSTSPESSNFETPKNRFIRRLHTRGDLVWMPFSVKFGAGWVVRDLVEHFYKNGYCIAEKV